MLRKTQIAIEYCYRFRDLHPKKPVFWVHGSPRQRLEQAYSDIAKKLKLPGWDDPAVDTLNLVSEWFNENDQWLMVLDNADDLDEFFPTSTSTVADVERKKPLSIYLPRDSHGLMLITTRDKRMSERLAGIHASIIVQSMTLSEAVELWRHHSERPHDWNNDDLRKLLVDLEYIPLAITQAASFIRQNPTNLTEYLELFRTSDSEIQDLLSKDSGDLRRDSGSQNSVFRTWKLSFDLISKQKPRAAEMLSLMAVLDRQGISTNLLQKEGDSRVDFITALGTLRAFSLITVEDNGTGYQLHRLVQLATQKWLELKGKKEEWQELALLVLAEKFPSGLFETWPTCESFLPHARRVIQYKDAVEKNLQQYSCLSQRIADFDIQQGRYEAACEESLAAFEVLKRSFGLEHPATLTSMEDLAHAYLKRGRSDKAEELAVHVNTTRTKVLGEEHPHTVSSMGNLAEVYGCQKQWDKAEKLQTQVMKWMIREHGEEHCHTMMSMDNLAMTYHHQRRWAKALRLHRRVIRLRVKVLGEEHSYTLVSEMNLALTYSERGWLRGAQRLEVKVMQTRIRVLGEEHPDTLDIMHNLALTYDSRKCYSQAIELMRKLATLRTKHLRANHPQTLKSIALLEAWSDAYEIRLRARKDPVFPLAIEDGNADR